MVKKKFYVTTPIYYANSEPHIGSVYTTVAADILARWHKLLGENVFFLTGTDEHGQKIQEIAQKNNLKPKEYVDKIANKFQQVFKSLNISNDYFIRTTNKEHEKQVKEILQDLYDKKLIYKGTYESYYCVGCEQYLNKNDLIDGKCVLHKKEPEIIKEGSYMFKLSNFQEEILKSITSEKFNILPKKRRNEMLSFIKQGINDIPISRLKSKVSWGIDLPFDKEHTCYVWVDAFWNYITGLVINKKLKEFWSPDIQLMANDILRVHATIWPALLISQKKELPKNMFIHGYFTVNGQKMSKSLGNVVNPDYLVEKYSTDTLRYFLFRNIPFGHDGDFSEKDLAERHNNELANKLGNLVSRTTTLAEKYGIKKVKENKLLKKLKLKQIQEHFENFEIDKSLTEIFAFVDLCNEYIQSKKPWETHDREVLYELIDSIKSIAILLWPYIPSTSEKISKNLGFDLKFSEIQKPLKNTKIKKSEILFKKI